MGRKSEKLTIRDVARQAGVSIGTVSRVMNRNESVGAEVRASVLKAIEQLNYTPSAVAQSMRNRSTLTVGCIVREIIIPPLAEFVRAAQTVFDEAGYSLLLSNSGGSREHEIELLKRLRARHIDGIMIGSYSRIDAAFESFLRSLDLPIVVVDRDEPQWVDAVMTDHAHGMRMAVEHLLDLGHVRIMLITGQEQLFPARERIRGYRDAFEARGLAVDQRMIRTGSFLSSAGYRTASSMLAGNDAPTAIIAGGIEMLQGVIRAVRVRGLRIPEDISIVGTGHSELAEFHLPPISMQYWDQGEMGKTAANLLLDRILMRTDAEPQRVLLPNTFIARGSTGPAPAS